MFTIASAVAVYWDSCNSQWRISFESKWTLYGFSTFRIPFILKCWSLIWILPRYFLFCHLVINTYFNPLRLVCPKMIFSVLSTNRKWLRIDWCWFPYFHVEPTFLLSFSKGCKVLQLIAQRIKIKGWLHFPEASNISLLYFSKMAQRTFAPTKIYIPVICIQLFKISK